MEKSQQADATKSPAAPPDAESLLAALVYGRSSRFDDLLFFPLSSGFLFAFVLFYLPHGSARGFLEMILMRNGRSWSSDDLDHNDLRSL